MKEKAIELIKKSKKTGWVMEPYAKEIFASYKLETTRYKWTNTLDDTLAAADEIRYPVVTKIVSPDIVHKTEVDGVHVNLENSKELEKAYKYLSTLKGFQGVIVEGMERGVELILGSKYDPQFGTVVMIGIGGTSVEIYKDVAITMAPVAPKEVETALDSLTAKELLHGFRGSKPVNMKKLTTLVSNFSKLAFELSDYVESIDCNPLFSNEKKSVIADARFILK